MQPFLRLLQKAIRVLDEIANPLPDCSRKHAKSVELGSYADMLPHHFTPVEFQETDLDGVFCRNSEWTDMRLCLTTAEWKKPLK
jgi:hypothetical protein